MLICQCNAMHRRDVVCAGGAAMFTAIVATLMSSSKPVKADAISGSVPELDGVAIRVVVDSYQFAVAPSRNLPMSISNTSAGALAAINRPARRWSVSSASRCSPRRGAVRKRVMS